MVDGSQDVESNFGKPKGFMGRVILRGMNREHLRLTEWALGLLPKEGFHDIIDIGCGGGNALHMMSSAYPDATLIGIDLSEESVRYARRHNRRSVEAGRCAVMQGSVTSLPFGDGSFDLVTAIETYFFWPSLEDDLREVVRVLSRGGTFMLVSEMYPHPDFNEKNDRWGRKMGFELRPVPELERILGSLGCDVDTILVEENNWMCIIAHKT